MIPDFTFKNVVPSRKRPWQKRHCWQNLANLIILKRFFPEHLHILQLSLGASATYEISQKCVSIDLFCINTFILA